MPGYIPSGKKQPGAQLQANPDTPTSPVDNSEDDQPVTSKTTDGLLTAIGLPPTDTTLLQHSVAKKPPFTMMLDTIRSKFRHQQFAEALEKFIRKSAESFHPSLRLAIEDAKYPVFKQFTITIPSPPQVTSNSFIRSIIHAKEGEPGDTVLAKPGLSIDDNTPIKWWDIHGMSGADLFVCP